MKAMSLKIICSDTLPLYIFYAVHICSIVLVIHVKARAVNVSLLTISVRSSCTLCGG